MDTKIQTPENYVPRDYEDLFRHYFPHVKRLVSSYRVDPQSVEDVSMTLLTKFVERESLEKYSETATFTHGGEEKTAKFSTYLSGFVFAYVRYLAHRERLTKHREVVAFDAPGLNGPGSPSWGEMMLPPVEDSHEDLYAAETTQHIRSHLRTLPVKRGADLVLLFDLICTQVAEEGTIVVKDLAALFEVHQNTIRNWIALLRIEVAAAMEKI